MNVLHRKNASPCCTRNSSGNCRSTTNSSSENKHNYSPLRIPSSASCSPSSSSLLGSYKSCLYSTVLVIVFVISYMHIMTISQPFLNTAGQHNTNAIQQPTVSSSSSSTSSIPTQEESDLDQQKLLQSFTADNDNQQNCTFQKPYSDAPVPLILMAMGRAGSSVTWNTLSTLLGSTTTAYEITGGNRTKSLNFFNGLQEKQQDSGGEDGLNWAVERLCHTQRYNLEHVENPVITGFQWKPYRVTLNHEYGKGALQVLGKYNHNRTNSHSTNDEMNRGDDEDEDDDDDEDNYKGPNIKVLLLSRNPLDRLISNIRHKGYIRSDEMPAHCAIDDKDCVNRHRAHAKGTVLPIGEELVHSMKSGLQIDRLSKNYLAQYSVDYITVQYEALFNDNGNVEEWVRIFDFLGREPKDVVDYRDNLTMEDIKRAFAMAPTSSKRHADTIANYDEVKETLEAAGLGRLLH